MTETIKTLIYAGVGVVLFGAAVFASLPARDGGVDEDKTLYPDFTDAKDAAQLEIVRVDETKGKLSRFEVERVGGRWVIPSAGNYPADASAQMTDAATSLINLQLIDVASEQTSEQELFGVVEPSEERLEAGDKGFGMLVAFKNAKGDDLAKLIVGKQDAKDQKLRFVRKAGQDTIYVVELNVDKLTTDFGDWIEKDLLKINPWDIDRVTIKDYQFIAKPTQDGFETDYDPRMDLTVGLDGDTKSWIVDKYTQYIKKREVPAELKPEEELNKEALDRLVSAIDNLQIVDVQAKPQGVAGAAIDEEAFENRKLAESLRNKGFMLAQLGAKRDLLGTSGELNVGTKDGVEYVLRFGNSAGADEGTTKDGEVKVRRYLFVSARVDQGRMTPPVLEDLPVAPATVPEPDKKEEGKEEGAKDEGDKGEEATDPADKKAAGDKQEGDDEKEPKKPTVDLELKRKQIEKENQRKIDDFNGRKKKAESKVKELNVRFGNWYYIISDDEFKKVHLTRTDAIKERTGPGAEGFGVDSFRELEQQGIIKPPPAPMGNFNPGGPGGLPPGINFGM